MNLLTLESVKPVVKDLNKSDMDISSALSSINQNAIFDEENAKLTSCAWDGKSSINGRTAGAVRERVALKEESFAYCVNDLSGKCLYFQPFAPGLSGFVPMTKTQAEAYGVAQKSAVVNEKFQMRVSTDLKNKLGNVLGGTPIGEL